MKDIPLKERIIFALDVGSKKEAEDWVRRLESHIGFYKVGLQLFIAAWFPVIDMIINRGHKVMVDLKFFDVPETVKQSVKQLRDRGISFVTVHGHESMLRAAVQEKGDLEILAVTVLTSLGQEDLQEMGFSGNLEQLVLSRARTALAAGCDGVVCSGLEAKLIRAGLGENFSIITPGIRPGAAMGIRSDDQKRIVTAQEAIMNGADHVVVGRPISKSKNPLSVIESMQNEIQEGLGVSRT